LIVVKQKLLEYTSINIETRYPNWDNSVTYDFGDIIFHDHYYFRSVVDNNVGDTPYENNPKWLLWSISNRYAQIDLHAGTSTVWDSNTATTPTDNGLITTFPSDDISFIGMGRVHSSEVTVTVKDSGGAVVSTRRKTTYPRPNSNTWYNYYFDTFVAQGEIESFFFDIPQVTGGTIEVKALADATGSAKVGFMICGERTWVGDTLFGISTGIEDNSIWDTDEFGIITVKERDASESLDLDVQYLSIDTNKIKIAVRGIVGKIVLFVGDEQTDSKYDHLMLLGKVDSFTPVISNPIMTKASFSVSEVI